MASDSGAILEPDVLRGLTQRSDARGWLQLGSHVGLLSATAFLVWASRGQAWLVLAVALYGVVLCFPFCTLHETTHRTAFASAAPNELIAGLCGALLMLPPGYFRFFHFAHHRFTQDPARDPELTVAPAGTLTSYLWRVSGLPYWRDRLTVAFSRASAGNGTEEKRVLQAISPCIAGCCATFTRQKTDRSVPARERRRLSPRAPARAAVDRPKAR
jgi:fatty acid desaturase